MKVVFLTALVASVTSVTASASMEIKGVNLQPYTDSQTLSYGTANTLNTMTGAKPFGVNAIGLRQYVDVPEVDSTTVTEGILPGRNEAGIRQEIEQEKAQGIATVFTLGTEVTDALMGLPADVDSWQAWHGAIDLGTPADIDQWFQNYEAILDVYAQLANEERIPVFSIGNELVSLTTTVPLTQLDGTLSWQYGSLHTPRFEKYATLCLNHLITFKAAAGPEAGDDVLAQQLTAWFTARDGNTPIPANMQAFIMKSENLRRAYLEKKWRTLISNVSLIYKNNFPAGVLTMNANHDAFQNVNFWDALDRIAISTYYGLTPTGSDGIPQAGPTDVQSLMVGWDNVVGIINQFLNAMPAGQQRPVLFTELGYTDRVYSDAIPWAFSGTYAIKLADGTVSNVDFDTRPVDLSERTNAIIALNQEVTAGKMSWLDGILFWDMYPLGRPKVDPYSLFMDSTDPTNAAITNLFN